MNRRNLFATLIAVAALAAPLAVEAQTSISEDFTGATTTNAWWFFNGACLTAGSAAGSEPNGGSHGQIPGCTAIATSYYNKSSGEMLVGGQTLSNSTPDPVGQGALRFTNGSPYGYSENGGIVYATPFPTGQGVSITFKTITYRGDSGGAGGDGADGISFFLMDSSQLNTTAITGVASGNGNGLGAWGGSLGYTCSNANPPYNGLNGGYLGVGIDEYGNFLNGTTNTLGETGTSATGDNTASGGGYQPGRIGLRGAGNISWLTLNGAYGTNPNNSAAPYYPSSLATSCAISGGTYNAGANACESCGSGTYNSGGNYCQTTTCSSGTYDASSGMCESCASGTYNASLGGASGQCEICPSGYTYSSSTDKCKKGTTTSSPTTAAPAASNPQRNAPNAGLVDAIWAVRNTCSTGNLWNYATASNPTSAGAASLTNPVNTGNPTASPAIPPILDYGALPAGYVVLPTGTQIANEAAMTRSAATPIFYQLKISQNGLLSLSYSICPPTGGCGAYQSVIKSQNITTANGPLPANFLFGFAGSTGGSSNIHEILCFKAAPSTSAASSAGASEKQSAKLETGTQAYFAYFNPSNGWTGRVTASSLGFDTYGNVVVGSTPNWDASCVLTGIGSSSTCSTTGAAGPVVAENPTASTVPFTSRQILSWNGSTGVGFEYGNLSTAQQATIDQGDVTTGLCNASTNYSSADRVNFLRGVRSCEVNTTGVGELRRRSSVLADIMDSSPIWVGSPGAPYTQTWSDRINGSDPLPENGASAQNYPTFSQQWQNRTQVVYVGANDGLLHGFRSGTFNSASSACTNLTAGTNPAASCWANNDGMELLAYMPGAVVNTIHSTTANVDYSNTQYGHNYFVNATPGTGDVFFNNAWHTWLVGGLGAGGAAIYALDITNPGTTTVSGSTAGNFAEANAASLVVGEWTSSTISCVGNTSCGKSLGNTYGTPQMRRLHDGRWAIIFGNGFGSTNGDAGIFVAVLDPTSGKPDFYYLSAGAGPNNGIAYTTPVDLDGDHITDYVYAGDLKGNVWRFDLTNASESSWAVTPGPLFTTAAGQPITAAIVAASGAPSPGMPQQLMLLFGTGQKIGLTNLAGNTYATAQQSLYGVWDWNMSGWNSISTAQYASLAAGYTGTLGQSNLAKQTVTVGSSGDVEILNNATICWSGSTACATNNNQYGWFLNLPSTQEQVIYSPELVAQALTVNTIVPAQNSPTSCAAGTDLGYTYVLSALTGGAFNQVFLPPSEAANPGVNTNQAYLDQHAIAMLTNATGSSFVTSNTTGTDFLVYETNQVEGGAGGNGNNIQGGSLGLNLPPNTTGHRLSWIELR
jgi:type IV pilus assembly protein PilY1